MTGKRINKPRQYTEPQFAAKKAEAKALFLVGKNPAEIDEILKLGKGRAAQWAHFDNWAVERQVILDKTTKTRLEELIAYQEGVIDELNVIREKAYDAIFTDEVTPRKFSEASNAYINAVEVLRKFKADSINESFMNDLVLACRELISDQALLARIGERFREIFNSHNQSTLSPNQKVIGQGKIEERKN